MEGSNFCEDYIFASGLKTGEYREGLYSSHIVERKLRGKFLSCVWESAAPMVSWSETANLPLICKYSCFPCQVSGPHTNHFACLPADGYSYQVENRFLAQARQCQSFLSVPKLMVTMISLVFFLFLPL